MKQLSYDSSGLRETRSGDQDYGWNRRLRRSGRLKTLALVRALAAKNRSRKILNLLYTSLTLSQKQYCHTQYAKIFRDAACDSELGTWQVTFEGKQLRLPVGGSNMWLSWDSALSLLGHETEIKRAYASIIRSPHRPTVFVDIGANYGLHSLLFLVHQIKTVSFEPNELCHSFFRQAAALNDVSCDIREVALSDASGFAHLWFPQTGTWYGTIVPEMRHSIPAGDAHLKSSVVKQTTLDNFIEETPLDVSLLKIDTEGSELMVLRGATKTLKQLRPLVIFECWPESDRTGLFSLLDDMGYRIATLRDKIHPPRPLINLESFQEAPNANFIAAPVEKMDGKFGVLRYL